MMRGYYDQDLYLCERIAFDTISARRGAGCGTMVFSKVMHMA
jgi:hypothetical protein